MIYWTRLGFSRRLLAFRRNLSTAGMDDVLFEVKNDVGIVTLNRPKALNALNMSMVTKILPKLKEYESQVRMVIVQGAGGKAFCAGGDVKSIVLSGVGATSLELGANFFRTEYSMNSTIGKYKIPYVSLIDGITMGGGVGISVHGKYRVATERTLFAMPETAIGLFCDVGGSHVLSRLDRHLGVMLGLTGCRLKGADVVKAGIATHFVHSSKMDDLRTKLIEDVRDPGTVLAENTEDLSAVEFTMAPFVEKIDSIFSHERVEAIVDALKADGSEWAQGVLKSLNEVSPTGLKITRKEISKGKNLSLDECLIMEHRLAYRCTEAKYSEDFFEGVRALLIDKDKSPKWCPASLEDVKDEIIDKYFEPLSKDKDLKFL
ncbi:3-hydroxyisobutyryl-CoA hydrolase, mitochondrial [Rhopalosiphum padi]|uniref:3-hydroxyisobutyryl-CoA hydrolase, mitochondrial n=1 Tax=Rhopalosiphum padi TaxID=40932 RepID=UPI00298DBD3E|nr:3-hydroxyisobutyryl-CoA hydrolase, mitochondrial [Rhopalosiphum padi]XP_060850005.1 3-hydroxyisobutyryl-CoA hydrolase, mitochondrial [Rhopalosiphum padi]